MKRSLPDHTANPNTEENYNQMCWRNRLYVALVDNSGSDEFNCMVEWSAVDPNENAVNLSRIIVDQKESNVDGSRRGVNGPVNVTSDDGHSIFQLATLAWKKLAQDWHPGMKFDFLPPTLREASFLIRLMRLRYLMIIRFKSWTPFICNMEE